jgi:vacuolar-type H+-ATPase subunit E/Vma4
MEEIASTDALEREILEDARRKGERILKDGDAEAQRLRSEHAEKSAKALAALTEDFRLRAERYHNENVARLPLEKGRMKATYVDRLLRAATERYLASLSEGDRAAFIEAILSRAAGLLAGGAVSVRFKGMSPAAARTSVGRALPRCTVTACDGDESLPATGVILTSADGKLSVRATMDLVGEKLLDDHRGELAAALCGEALAL